MGDSMHSFRKRYAAETCKIKAYGVAPVQSYPIFWLRS